MERELSLYVPAASQADLVQAMRAHTAQGIPLRALYFDTASRALAKAGIALRIRLEGTQWVQTVKAPGHDPLSRIEINHPRPQAELDLALYDESPLAGFFAQLSEPLQLRYETDVHRLVVQVEREGSVIEIAYDDGAILANSWTLPINEVEFELVSGDMQPMFDLAGQWLAKHGLILEIRSKAHRGDRLAELDAAPAGSKAMAPPYLFEARRAKRINLSPDMPPVEQYTACVGECLTQIMANASLLAGVDTQEISAEAHALNLKQLRLGIRRLYSWWQRFPALAPAAKPPLAQALAQSRPEQLQATAAGPEFQAMLLSLLKHLIQVGDTARQGNTPQNQPT